ncbi:hypothetical protein DL346_22350 [Paenibacillus montanisoli]|uniref:Uncharacterized protein n=1 Tax=Paenibacillus montanisoli TaxID=2081970 RepID=A0A328TYF0_9BACL|nr:hypothetical protein DL346_22350 [Paenibacillus montanisoli]
MQNKNQKFETTLKGAIIFLGICILVSSCVIANRYYVINTNPSDRIIIQKLDQIVDILSTQQASDQK